MMRAIRPAGTALALALAVAGCGSGDGPATSGLATPGAPGTTDGPVSTGAVPPATTAPDPGGAPTPEEPPVTEADQPVPCPSDQADRGGAFDARELEGRTLADAEAQARAHGCSVRVARRDGRDLALTQDLSTSRVNVEVAKGRVTRVLGVN